MHARRGEWFLLSCFSLCLLKVFAKRHIDLAFEQDLDGTFVRGGRIHGTFNPQGASSLTLQREEWGTSEKEAFSTLVNNDGYYRLRVPSSGDTVPHALMFSLPACCLLGVRDIRLQATESGALVGLSCDSGETGCGWHANCTTAGWSPPLESHVLVALPRRAVDVAVDPASSLPGAPQPQSAGARSLGSLRQPAEPSKGEGEGATEGEDRPPPPDQRTWFQKNWIFVLPIVMLVMNVMGAVLNPQGGADAPGGGAGTGNGRPPQARLRQR